MILLSSLGCSSGPPPVTTVQGVQVVAIEAIPPNPLPEESVKLRIWVADALGLGADVLVWMCTPVLGTCVEAWLPGTQGMPLGLWTATGQTDRVFEIERPWPYFRELTVGGALGLAGDSGIGTDLPVDLPADEAPSLIIGALACVPGRCPAIDAARAEPLAGSDAWRAVVAGLANPALMLEGVPAHQASVAVKEVPLWVPTDNFTPIDPGVPLFPDNAPVVTWRHPCEVAELGSERPYPSSGSDLEGGPCPEGLDPLDPRVPDRVDWWDPDSDSVSFQAFTTLGAVSVTEPPELFGTVLVTRRPDPRGRVGDVFLVADDGRGGTTVWDGKRSASGTTPVCGVPGVLQLQGGAEVRDWETLVVGRAFQIGVRLRGVPESSAVVATLRDASGRELASNRTAVVFASGCPTATPEIWLQWTEHDGPCRHGGELATLETRVETHPLLEATATVVLALEPEEGCSE